MIYSSYFLTHTLFLPK